MKKSKKISQIDWHSGFAGGLSLCMRQYNSHIIIEREHNLTKEPLRMDFLIIKKTDSIIIDNDIGRAFRKYNIIEYKNPNDDLNIDVIWKVIGYAGIYKSTGKRFNEIPANEITLTVIRARKPNKLFNMLKAEGNGIIEEKEGIYRIDGIISIPLRIVVLNEIDDRKLLALKIMRYNADENDIRDFLTEASIFNEQGDLQDVNAVVLVSGKANSDLYDRLRGEDKMNDFLMELMADEIKEVENKCIKQGIEQGIEKRDAQKIAEMLNAGKTPEAIADFCNYPLEQVKKVQEEMLLKK